jgi:hypothetical protein
VWIAASDPVAGISGNWAFLIAIVTSGSAVAVVLIQSRRARPTKRAQQKHLRSASDEAVREYRELYVDELRAEVKRLQGRVTSAENRAELYRQRWDDCLQDRRDDN